MSPWSETDDTQRKWFSYRKIASLRHYLVVAQDRREVLVHSRAGDLWRERFVSEGSIDLDDPPLALALDDLYEDDGSRRLRRHAPYLPSRPAWAIASGIRYFASNWPSPPRRHGARRSRATSSRPAAVGREQRRHRVPAVALELARRAVVAGHDQHVGRRARRSPAISASSSSIISTLRGEVAVLAGAVGVLVVQEEEVVVVPVPAPASRSARPSSLPGSRIVHADQPGQAPVHRVDGDGGGAQAVDLLHRGRRRLPREAAQRDHVGRLVVLEDLGRLGDELADQPRGRLGSGFCAFGASGR